MFSFISSSCHCNNIFWRCLQLVREHKIRLVQHVPYEDIVLETCDKGGAFSG